MTRDQQIEQLICLAEQWPYMSWWQRKKCLAQALYFRYHLSEAAGAFRMSLAILFTLILISREGTIGILYASIFTLFHFYWWWSAQDAPPGKPVEHLHD